jgi:tRNA-specific 2-thiouridylase
MPFYAVNATAVFKDQVLDYVIGRVLSGQTFEPIVFYNRVLMDVLQEKKKKFNTNLMATGHYAKVLKNQKTGTFEVMVANDLVNDQSYLISRLDKSHLDGLLLPLSEIRKTEVEKISKLIKVDYIQRNKSNRAHIMHDPRMITLIEARVPKDLRKPGAIYKYHDDTNFGDHAGIYHYYIGKKGIKLRPEIDIDPELEVISIVPFKGNVFLGYRNELKFKHALIVQFIPADGLDLTLPINAFVKTGVAVEKLACTIYFKNNRTCIIEYKEEQVGSLVQGQFVAIYTRQGEKGKILGSGIVELSGVFANGNYHNLPEKVKNDENILPDNLIPNDKLFF